MREVKVKRDDALAIIRENRSKHRAVFEAATEGYRERIEQELQRRLDDLRAGRKISTHIAMVEPEDHTLDYDRVIKMMEMSLDDEITLGASEFDQFINDRWQWRENFLGNSSQYAAGAVAQNYG